MSEEINRSSPLSKIAALLCVAPIVGLAYSIWVLIPAFNAVATGIEAGAPMGPDDPVLQKSIGQSLFVTAVGIVLAIVGFPLSLWCIFGRRQRQWWLVTAATVAGLFFAWTIVSGTWHYLHSRSHPSH
jgi:biopolymer transport protein ExbB/TolQ